MNVLFYSYLGVVVNKNLICSYLSFYLKQQQKNTHMNKAKILVKTFALKLVLLNSSLSYKKNAGYKNYFSKINLFSMFRS